MADDVSKHGPDEDLRIESAEDFSYWSDKLGIPETQLRELVAKVGPTVLAVEKVLGKYSPTSTRR